jgi:hypothetical protein
MFEILLDMLSPRRQPLFYFYFLFLKKKMNLENNPKMGYDTNNQAKHA